MRYDIIIGNPPYQLKDGGHAASAKPIYHKFIQGAKALDPQYISFIVPARWYTGGKGLRDFRAEMLADGCISHLVDYPDAAACFKDVAIEGGVCYFLRDKSHRGETAVSNWCAGKDVVHDKRFLNEYEWFIRHSGSISILRKVMSNEDSWLNEKVSARSPFGLTTYFSTFDTIKQEIDQLKLYANGIQGYVSPKHCTKLDDRVNRWKVLVSGAYGGGSKLPAKVLGTPIVAGPQSVCTETYIIINHFNVEQQAIRFVGYCQTRFFRFMVSLLKNTQHNSKEVFSFVPDLPMTEEWTDEKLYERYALDADEIAFIVSQVRETPTQG